MNKKGTSSLMGVVGSIVLVILMFSGFFLFFTDQLEKNDLEMDSKYNTTYNQLLEVQSNMDTRVNDIKTTADEVREAESGFIVAINGFKGMGQSLLLLLGFTSDSIDTTQALLLSTGAAGLRFSCHQNPVFHPAALPVPDFSHRLHLPFLCLNHFL